LGSGNYIFKVKAKHEQGEYGEPLSYSFRIRPPWYQSKLAYLIYGLLLVGLIYFFVKDRIRRVVEKIKLLEEIRSKISADLHDDVGSILTGIAMQAEYLAIKKPENIEDEMDQLSTRSREAMDKMRDIVWAMDARKDKMINLVDKMQYFAALSFENSRFKFDIQNTLSDDQAFIHPLVRQQIYLVFKEAVTNILKHSNGNKVEIQFKEEAENLMLLIKDNGTTNEVQKSEGAGLENMRERIKQIKGELKIEMDGGFLIRVICPKNMDSLGYS
jgi:signal transduction histidine kinase